MGWFKKKDRVLDLTEHYNQRRKEMSQTNDTIDLTSNSDDSENTNNPVGIFGGVFGDTNSSIPSENSNLDVDEKRRRLARRLKDMTDKLEDVSNQIYHLQQRIEVLERKSERY